MRISSGIRLYPLMIYILSLLAVMAVTVSSDMFVFCGAISLILFVMFCWYLYKHKQYFFFLLMPFIFPHFTAIISNLSLETGAYIEELQVMSYATGGTTRLVFYILSFFMVAMMTFNFFNKYRISRYCFTIHGDYSRLEKQIIILLSVLIFSVLALNAVLWGSPLLQGVQRFDYWASHPHPGVRNFLYQGYLLSFVLGVYISKLKLNDSKDTSAYIYIIFVFCFFNVLYGEKFTGVFLTLLYFFIGLFGALVVYKKINIINSRTIIFIFVFSVLLYGLIYYQYKYIHQLPGSIFSFIESRILNLQGEVWWAIDGGGSTESGLSYLYAYSDNCKITGGLYSLMYQIAPSSLVDSYCERGITFTMGYPAILISSVGYISGYIFNILFGFLVGITLFLIKKSIEHANIISLFLSAKVLLIETHALNMGNIYNIIDFKFLIYFLLLLFFSELRLKNAKINSPISTTVSSGKTE
ncbi:MAG TPA: DUF6418 domain-containing protein [Scandinavium sp.]|uniref:DUF6418 domain-containing protein n=1 Tax=Scandinavium sp. TaxID=2830653 RepID=UPI002E3152F9|nr:DUF6418 domain-containing protein [Scandinavium sp.]HEX4500172.1 DUF6418 domain-containing protein [Scandinavium sp.]